MKSAVSLWLACLKEAGRLCGVRTDADERYARRRISEEGLSFLTIALPQFEKDLLVLISGGSASDLFVGFKRRGGLPAFMSGFLRQILKDTVEPSYDQACVLRCTRQVLLLLSKVELPTTEGRNLKALRQYVTTDGEVAQHHISSDLLSEFRVTARRLFAPLLVEAERAVYDGQWMPGFSSGALATRESFNGRFGLRTWTQRLQDVLPWWNDLALNPHWEQDVEVEVLPPSTEPPVRVALVPKTMKTPRIIAMEPSWQSYVQQGILRELTGSLRRHPEIARLCGWLDQEPNRRLCSEGSVDGRFSTIDLSEASDRVSYELAQAVYASAPFLWRCIAACRSRTSVLPSGEVIELAKFASMGSALTFPTECLVFQTLCVMAMHRAGTSSQCNRVFGDDIIIPTDAAHHLVSLLEAFGLKVNYNKSFTTGRFRESCGVEWWGGHNVGVLRLRHDLDTGHRGSSLGPLLDLQHRLWEGGWIATAGVLGEWLTHHFPGVPQQPEGTRVLAVWRSDIEPTSRWNKRLQRLEFRGIVPTFCKPVDDLNGYGALRKFFAPHSKEREADHLHRDGRSRFSCNKTGWIAPVMA